MGASLPHAPARLLTCSTCASLRRPRAPCIAGSALHDTSFCAAPHRLCSLAPVARLAAGTKCSRRSGRGGSWELRGAATRPRASPGAWTSWGAAAATRSRRPGPGVCLRMCVCCVGGGVRGWPSACCPVQTALHSPCRACREAARHQVRDKRQAARQAEVQQRVAAQAAAEADKMAGFRALLAAGPIQIAKRGP